MAAAPRRRRLARAVKLLALAGGLAMLVPLAGFLGDTLSGAIDGAPADTLEVDLDGLPAGGVLEVEWRGRPLLIHRPAGGEPPVVVLHPFESRRGCRVHHLPAGSPEAPPGWRGGFREPCFNALFDATGRRIAGSGHEDQTDLAGPSHRLAGPGLLVIAGGD